MIRRSELVYCFVALAAVVAVVVARASTSEGLSGRLAFLRNDGLYLMDLQTRQERLLVDGCGIDYSWSPDGERILYNEQAGNHVAHVSVADGTVVTLGPRGYCGWSPNGREIVYQAGFTIRAMSADGGADREVLGGVTHSTFPEFECRVQRPIWSPTADVIYFDVDIANMFLDAWSVRADGSDVQVLTPGVGMAYFIEPSPLSPDGSMVVLGGRGLGQKLHVLGVDKSRVIELGGSDFRAAWSPDSRSLAYTSDMRPAILVVSLDGASPLDLLADYSLDGLVHLISWAPDGSRLAFELVDWSADTSVIHIVDSDGSGLQALTEGSWPRWSPAGSAQPTAAHWASWGEIKALTR
jgi:Tol biopolymer transport system component